MLGKKRCIDWKKEQLTKLGAQTWLYTDYGNFLLFPVELGSLEFMWGRGENYITGVQIFFTQSDSSCRPLGLIGYYQWWLQTCRINQSEKSKVRNLHERDICTGREQRSSETAISVQLDHQVTAALDIQTLWANNSECTQNGFRSECMNKCCRYMTLGTKNTQSQ